VGPCVEGLIWNTPSWPTGYMPFPYAAVPGGPARPMAGIRQRD
jgi:hypothetical protein